jgi:STE24 endopeptidase
MVLTIFWIIIAIIIFDFVLGEFLDYLNLTRMKETVPEELVGIYDENEYRRSQQYSKVKSRFSSITNTFSLVLLLIMLFAGGFSFIDQFVRSISDNDYIQALLFFGIIGLGGDLLSLPFQIYSTFIIESRFGFNKTTPLTFFTDKIKSLLLSVILGGGVLLFVMWAWKESGYWFWIIVMVGMTLLLVFITIFYSQIIVPLFNKQTALEEGTLKDKIDKFAENAGFKIKNIFVIDGSRRSTKANAYFTGLGKKKRIVLYDTLINDLKEDEIVAVLAHEIGHNKLNHVYMGLFMSLVQSGLMLYLLYISLGLPELSLALGASQPSFYMGILAFGLLFSPISTIIGLITNMVSRKHEYQADAYAAKYGLGENLISGLITLSVSSLSNLTPHPLYVFFNYSHPTLLQRKKALLIESV